MNLRLKKENLWSIRNIKPYECNDIAPFIIGSFDIECNSYDGSFPCAIKTYEKPLTYYRLL